MRKPSFKVVTNVVVLLALLGVFTVALSPRIPKRSINKLDSSREAFLRQAAYQNIRWLPNSPSAYSRARNESKPILFVVGGPWSEVARRMDMRVFRDPNVARYLTHNFICVRVDASEDRKWLAAFFPYSRMPLNMQPGFQAWVLDSQARMIDLVGHSPTMDFNAEGFLDALMAANALVDQVRDETHPPILPNQSQQEDVSYLRASPRSGWPDFHRYQAELEGSIDSQFGGFPLGGTQPVLPSAFRYLLLTGSANYDRAIQPVMFSSLTDLMDGGFFRRAIVGERRTVSYDKLATLNAEMAWLLALDGALNRDPAARILARSAFDAVSKGLAVSGLIATARTGVSLPNGRSPRHSIGLAKLHRRLTRGDVAWAEENLNLRPADNPQMVPYFENSPRIMVGWPHAQRIMRRMNGVSEQDPLVTPDSAEAHCHSAARLLQTARLWRSDARTALALVFGRAAERFRVSGEVRPRTNAPMASDYIGDWLGYSDACLQRYLLTGSSAALEAGKAVLEKALVKFEGEVTGEYLVSKDPGSGLAPHYASVPEVADNLQESCTARVIRLCDAYGRLYGGWPAGEQLRRRALEAVDRYSVSLADAGPSAAGYFCAAWDAHEPETVFAAGPQAVSMANELFRLVPNRLIAPAIGPVRRDLQNKKPGVYIATNRGVEGPLTVADAFHRLQSLASDARDGT
jgi:uncharacterized protein YyaL (SSP411 family)